MNIATDTEVTHVISWLPGYLVAGASPGFWELHTIADYWAGEPPLCDDWYADLPRDAGEQTLAQWAASTLGFPVSLEAGEHDVRRHRFFGRFTTVPLFSVRRTS